MRQTTIINNQDVEKKWFILDAKGQTLGKLSTFAAAYLRGKHKPTFTPHTDMGDNIIVINAEQILLTGNKEQGKLYYSHSGYHGGLKSINAAELRKRKPTAIVERSIKGMLPHTKLGNKQRKNLYVFEGPSHDKDAQKPEMIEVK